MPVAGIVIGAAVSAVSITSAGALAFSFAAFAGSLVLGAVSYALTPKPKGSSASGYGSIDTSSIANKGQTVAVRQSDLTRQNVYGHVRITRGYAHMQSTGVNGVMHCILILCEGELRAINEVWVNDYCIPNDWLDADGNVTQGRYKDKMQIRKHLGADNQLADTVAVANMPSWTSDHRLQGIAYIYVKMIKDQDTFPTGLPNLSAIVEGPVVWDPREESTVWTTNIALFGNDFIQNTRYGFGAFEDDVDPVNIAAQANICDEIVDTESETILVSSVSDSMNAFTLNGTILSLQFGDRVQVTSTGSLPGGISAATNYYVIPYQVKDTPRIMLATSLANSMAKTVIDLSSAGSGSMTIVKNGEPRYHGGGVIDSETILSQTLNDIVNGMAGRAICIGGFWTLLAGAWRTPAVSLGISDLRGTTGLKNCLSMSESYNVIKGLFISSLNMYQTSDYPAVQYPTFIEQDNGIESIKDINLPFTNRRTTAQRIAKIELFRGRQDIVFNNDFSTFALRLQPGDTVDLTIDRYGWEEKYFEVTQFSFDINNGSIVTRLILRETAQEIYDWSSGEAIDYDPAPNTNLPNPFFVSAVTGLAYSSRAIGTVEGDELFMLVLNWDVHPDQFVVNFGDFEVQYKLASEVDWRPSFFVDGGLVTTDVLASSVNVYYDVRVRARNNLGVRSAWNTLFNVIVGSSGGVTATYDYEFVDDPVGSGLEFDYGFVTDPVGSGLEIDWGYV